MMDTYKHQFLAIQDAARYDENEYREGSYAHLLWELEKSVLRSLVEDLRRAQDQIQYLDFATGTGRIAAFLENLVDSATAIDLSDSMIARARQRLRLTNVICGDITADTGVAKGNYNLITAFRFFLNAEPALRLAAMRALAARLRDESSLLVFNNHGNLWSPKILLWPYYRVRSAHKSWQTQGNYLRHSQIMQLLESTGLRVVRVIGLGLLGGKIAGRMSFDRSLRLERWFSSNPFCSNFGQDQIYVAGLNRKASGNITSRTEA